MIRVKMWSAEKTRDRSAMWSVHERATESQGKGPGLQGISVPCQAHSETAKTSAQLSM